MITTLTDTRRINHSIAYSLDGACTNQAESSLARLWGMSQYANHGVRMEDHRRLNNGTLA
jgi:hypothetical protein